MNPNPLRLELEKKFIELPSLKHVGMALGQFAFKLQNTDNCFKDPFGVYCLDFVSFDFPKGKSSIKLFVRNVDIESEEIRQFGFRWLPLTVEDGFEKGLAVCQIFNAGQLAQAAKYIWLAHQGYMGKRWVKPDLTGN